jgi:hypothetical protein
MGEKVYIIIRYTEHEDEQIISVHKTIDGANEHCLFVDEDFHHSSNEKYRDTVWHEVIPYELRK